MFKDFPEAPARFWKKAALSLDKKKEPIKGYDTKYKFEAVISWRPFENNWSISATQTDKNTKKMPLKGN